MSLAYCRLGFFNTITMRLLTYEGYNITIDPMLLALKPFRTLWNRDRSSKKEKAIQEIGYIYFMEDPRSDYQYITDVKERAKNIKEGEGIKDSWKPDSVVKEAQELYSSFKTPAALLLEDTRVAVDKLRKLLREIDLTITDDKGKPVYTLNTITSTIKQIPSLVKELDEAERALAKEMVQSDKARGGNTKSIYEDL